MQTAAHVQVSAYNLARDSHEQLILIAVKSWPHPPEKKNSQVFTSG
jgi:hypothetical protein